MATASGGVALSPEEVNRILDDELTEEYHRLRYTPGYCLEPLSWKRMQQLLEVSGMFPSTRLFHYVM